MRGATSTSHRGLGGAERGCAGLCGARPAGLLSRCVPLTGSVTWKPIPAIRRGRTPFCEAGVSAASRQMALQDAAPAIVTMQASMLFQPAQVAPPPPDADQCLSVTQQHDFCALSPVAAPSVLAFGPSCVPGRIQVFGGQSGTTGILDVLGDMTSLHPSLVPACARRAQDMGSQMWPFLQLCSRHGLAINKYLRARREDDPEGAGHAGDGAHRRPSAA